MLQEKVFKVMEIMIVKSDLLNFRHDTIQQTYLVQCPNSV